MIKLISLQGFLNLSDNAIKKISDELSTVGLEADNVLKYDDADDFLDAVGIAVDERHTAIVAVENEEYNVIKRQIIGKFSLESKSSPDIAEAISREREELLEGRLPDMEDHCLVPSDAALYITGDGLYCGFCVEFAGGARLIYVPLDLTRLDTLLEYVKEELDESDDSSKEQPPQESPNTRVLYSSFEDEEEKPIFEDIRSDSESISYEESVDLTGFEEAVANAGKAVYSLIQLDKTVAFVDCEYSKYIKAISKKVDGMPDAFVFDDTPLDGEDELEPQIALARKTRLALRNTGADFGAAISPILEGEKDGKSFYYSYIIIHDGASAKAKKVSTSNQQGAESLISHAFTLMFELLSQKAEILTAQQEHEEEIEDKEKKKRIVTMVACIAVAAVAIISAVIMVWRYLSSADDIYNTTTDPNNTISDTAQNVAGLVTDSTSGSIPQSSSNIPAITAGNSVSNTEGLTTDSNYQYPGEPTAGNVSASVTAAPVSSQSGTFTFTVYGYGHGVGMSQNGANYYANIGWNYLEILAMYYYGTNLVIGEQYPATVSFAGTSYSTRDYLAIAVESEMGSTFETEALKAQAVAIYTYAKYCNFNVTVTAHAFDKTPSEKAYAAVDAVIGQYVSYNGEACQTLFHAMSAYKTASYANTFGGGQVAYLSGGRPSYGDVEAENYMTTVTLTSDELKAKVYSTTGIELTGDPSTWLKIVSHDACINENLGYVSYIQVGGQVYTGYKFRLEVLGGAIRSHCFTINYTPNTAIQ